MGKIFGVLLVCLAVAALLYNAMMKSAQDKKKAQIAMITPKINLDLGSASSKPSPTFAAVSPLLMLNTARIYLISTGGTNNLSVNQNFKLQVIANSVGQNIVAFDLVIPYDRNRLSGYADFVSAQSLLSDFDIYVTNKDNLIVITGVKNIADKSKTFFENEPIVSIVFRAVKAGKFVFNLPLLKDNPTMKTSSKLMTDKNEDILQKTEPWVGLIN